MIRFFQTTKLETGNFHEIKGPPHTFRDGKCLGRKCFLPEGRILFPKSNQLRVFNTRNNIGRSIYVCGIMYDFGCPEESESPESFDQELFDQRIADGWQSTPL